MRLATTTSMRRFGAALLGALALAGATAASASADALGPEIQVSNAGPSGQTDVRAGNPSLAYNPDANQYLSVWDTNDQANGAKRIAGQLLDATGNPIGSVFSVSTTGPSVAQPGTNLSQTRSDPIAVYNPRAKEYMVVWHATPAPPVVTAPRRQLQQVSCQGDPQPEPFTQIVGQRLDSSGARLGPSDFPISSLGQPCPRDPALAYSPDANGYLVVWGDESGSGTLFGQVLPSSPTALSNTSNFQISDGSATVNGEPGLAYDPIGHEYLAAWQKGVNSGSSDNHIVSKRIDSAGNLLDSAEVNLSNTPPATCPLDNTQTFTGQCETNSPNVSFNGTSREFLVLWEVASFDAHYMAGQRVTEANTKTGPDNLPLSFPQYTETRSPASAWDPNANQYQFVFQAAGSGEAFVQGQVLDAAGTKIGTDGFSISSNLGDEEPRSIVYNTHSCDFLMAWEGLLPRGGNIDTNAHSEIFVRRLAAPACPVPPPPPPARVLPPPLPPPAAARHAKPRVRVAGISRGCVSRSINLGFSVNATGLRRVDVFLDGKRVLRTTRAKFKLLVHAGNLRAGRHKLRTVAIDSSGQTTTTQTVIRRCALPARVAPRFTG